MKNFFLEIEISFFSTFLKITVGGFVNQLKKKTGLRVNQMLSCFSIIWTLVLAISRWTMTTS